MRTFAVADIHGCSEQFQQLLRQMGFQRSDMLYILGDMIDRGPDSKAVVEGIMNLAADGYKVFPVMGNHEKLLLDCIETGLEYDMYRWTCNGGLMTLQSYGVDAASEIPENHVFFLQNLPLYRITDSHVFVHAGINPCSDPFSAAVKEDLLWRRTRCESTENIGGRTLVTGHTPKTLIEIEKSLLTKHIQLDNGCFMSRTPGYGRLAALELENMKLHTV